MKAVPLARSPGAELPNPQGLSQAPFTSAPPHPAVSMASSDYSPRAGDFEERAEHSLTSCPTTGSAMPCWRTLRQTSFVQLSLHSVGREVTRQALQRSVCKPVTLVFFHCCGEREGPFFRRLASPRACAFNPELTPPLSIHLPRT